jgi:hypothetical protein
MLRANGSRYPLVGGTRERRFDGNNLKRHKLLENAPTPTSRVHAMLGAQLGCIIGLQVTDNRIHDIVSYHRK